MKRSGNGSGRKKCGRLRGCEKADSKGMGRGIEVELMEGARGRRRDLIAEKTRMKPIGSILERTKMMLSRVKKRKMIWMEAARRSKILLSVSACLFRRRKLTKLERVSPRPRVESGWAWSELI